MGDVSCLLVTELEDTLRLGRVAGQADHGIGDHPTLLVQPGKDETSQVERRAGASWALGLGGREQDLHGDSAGTDESAPAPMRIPRRTRRVLLVRR